ncbi:hypothetical protein Hanom_Chr03g00211711 [Helianthus anomalus]
MSCLMTFKHLIVYLQLNHVYYEFYVFYIEQHVICVIIGVCMGRFGSVLTKNHNHNRDVGYWISITITDRLWWLWFGFDGYSGSVMCGYVTPNIPKL